MKAHIIRLALFAVGLCPFASAQWTQIGVGSPVTSFAVVGSSIFAGTSGAGVFYSTDSGSHWRPTASSPADPCVRSLIAMDTTLFALTDSLGVFLSRDKGQHWIAVNNGLPNVGGLFLTLNGSIAILGTKVFLHGYEGTTYPPTYMGFYCSTDQGAHWGRTGSDINTPNNGLLCLGAFGTTLFAGAEGGNPNGGLFLSTNSGASWVSANNGMRDQHGRSPSVHCCTEKDGNLFVGTYNGVFRSIDSGNTWIAVNTGLPTTGSYARDVRCLVFRGSTLFAGTSTRGVFLSTNNGATWTEANSGSMGKDISSLCVCGSTILVGTGCGLFYSSDSGGSWSVAQGLNPFLRGFIQPFLIRGTELFIGVHRGFGRGPHASNIMRSTDNGNSWMPQADFASNALISLGSELFAGTNAGVFRSIDSGQHWTSCSKGLPAAEYDSSTIYVSSLASDGQNIFAVAGQGIYGSFDKGVSWIERSAGVKGLWITQLLASGSYLFAGTDTSGVFRSADNGSTWNPVNNGLPRNPWNALEYERITSLAAAGHDIFAGTHRGAYRLPVDGNGWSGVNNGLAPSGNDSSVACFAVNSGNLFAGTYSGGAFLSTNNGTSWDPINAGLPRDVYGGEQCGVLSMAATGTYLYASPGFNAMEAGWDCAGLWRRPLSDMITSADPITNQLPQKFLLSQNYPNPFNPSTTIKFELPKSSMVRLTVYDLLGREVSVLVNERKNAGSHEVTFDAAGLASGVYYYRMQAGEFVQVKKAVIVK